MKKVYRSRHTKVLGGVAAGLADYFSMDVTVMRLLFALLLVTIPNAIIAYILAWIIIPEEPLGMSTSAPMRADTGGATMTEKSGELPQGGMTAEEILKNQGDPFVPDIAGAPQAPAQAPVTTSNPKEVRGSGDRSRQLLGYILIAIGAAVVLRRYVPSFVWRLPSMVIGQAWPILIILAGVAIIYTAVRGR